MPTLEIEVLSHDQLTDTDEELLELLRDGRVTAPFAAEELDASQEYIRSRLRRFVDHGHAEKVYAGLYELVDDPQGETGQEPEERPQADYTPPGNAAKEIQPPDRERGRDGTAEELLHRFDLPGDGSRYDARVNAVLAFYEYLRERPGERVSKDEFRELADRQDLDVGYSSFGSLWTNWVKKNESQGRKQNTLTRLPGVEMDSDEYIYTNG